MSQNKTFEIKLTGWWAIPALVAAIIFSYLQYSSMRDGLHAPAMTDSLKSGIKMQYYSKKGEELKAKIASGDPSAKEGIPPVEVDIQEISVRGYFSKNQVIRVKALLNGEPSPTGDDYYYFSLSHSFFFGWGVPLPSSEFMYKAKFF